MSNIIYLKVDLDEVENDMRAAMETLNERCRKLGPMKNPPKWLLDRRRPTLGSQGTDDKTPETPDP